ncbi:hypothetical protein [uncultured Methanomethylovorans sp.]|uniref:hypothetical protein n=1 Tax=uncultured Methanomethylovorans sp. TaxID=183759 RepID=UPI002AA7B7D4|nr:hypothetical protein [uncultured Methanomethylovorans sp.]
MCKLKLLRKDYDLSQESDIDLSYTMRNCCETFDQCYSNISTETSAAWESIVRIAVEIAERRGYSCIPADLLEQTEREEIRKISLADMGDNDLVEELRARGYMIHLTTGPKTAHVQIE